MFCLVFFPLDGQQQEHIVTSALGEANYYTASQGMERRKKIYKGVTLIYSMQYCDTCKNAVDMFWPTFTRLSFTHGVCVRYGNTFALAFYVHLLYSLVVESGQELNICQRSCSLAPNGSHTLEEHLGEQPLCSVS